MKRRFLVCFFLVYLFVLVDFHVEAENLPSNGIELMRKGDSFLKVKARDSAAYYYLKAIEVFNQSKEWEKLFKVEGKYCNMLSVSRKGEEVIKRLSIITKKADSLGMSLNKDIVYAYQLLGISYDRVGRHTAGVKNFLISLEGNKQLVKKDTALAENVAKAFNNVAVSLMQGARYELSEIYFDSALYELKKIYLEETELEHVIYLNKGSVNRKLGYYNEAEIYYKKSLSMFYLADISPVDKGLAFWYYSAFFHERNKYETDLDKALQYNDSANFYLKDYVSLNLYCLYQYAVISNGKREYEKGLDYILKAIDVINERYGATFHELAEVYIITADLYLGMGNIDEAIVYLNKSLKFYQDNYSENRESRSMALIKLGNCYFSKGNWKEALSYYQESMKNMHKEFMPDDIMTNPLPQNLANSIVVFEALKRKAIVLSKLYEKTDSIKYITAQLACYELMIDEVDLGRQGLIELESKMAYNEKKYNVYEQALKISLKAFEKSGDREYLKKAFHYTFASKANQLNGRIQQANHRNISEQSYNKLLLEVTDLRLVIGKLKKDIYYNIDNPALKEELQNDLFESQNRLRLLSDSINYVFPNYNIIDKGKLDLDKLKANLKKSESLLIEFVALDNELVIFKLGEQLDVLTTPYDKELKDKIITFKSALEKRDYQRELAFDLYQKILKPVLSTVKGNYEKLLIIPDGLLSILSFESLLSKKPEKGLKDHFLILDYDITYNYSTQLTEFSNESNSAWTSPFIGFSPDYGEIENGNVSVLRGIPGAEGLLPLPGAKREVEDISRLFKGKHFFGDEANESNFKNLATNSKYLHIAAHAISENEEPLLSKVLLIEDDNSEEDGIVYAYEIYNMKLNTDLVVLSACNTGTGKYQKGEGMISLASSFMYAGSDNLITSLWSVPDQPTSVIMTSFYNYLKDDESKSNALRRAKLDYLENADSNTSNPYYWAGFILIGELDKDDSVNYWKWILLVGLITMIIISFKVFKKST